MWNKHPPVIGREPRCIITWPAPLCPPDKGLEHSRKPSLIAPLLYPHAQPESPHKKHLEHVKLLRRVSTSCWAHFCHRTSHPPWQLFTPLSPLPEPSIFEGRDIVLLWSSQPSQSLSYGHLVLICGMNVWAGWDPLQNKKK